MQWTPHCCAMLYQNLIIFQAPSTKATVNRHTGNEHSTKVNIVYYPQIYQNVVFNCFPHWPLLAELVACTLTSADILITVGYSSSGKQQVRTDNARSQWLLLSKLVSQRYNSCHLLFNFIINNTYLCIDKCNLYNSADDNSLSFATDMAE